MMKPRVVVIGLEIVTPLRISEIKKVIQNAFKWCELRQIQVNVVKKKS